MTYNSLAKRFALFDSDPSDEEGGGGGDPTSARQEAETVVMSLLARAGLTAKEVPDGARKVMRKLARENYKYRSNIRELKERVAPDGSVILEGDEAKAYEAFTALEKSPEQMKEALERLPTLESDLSTLRQEQVVGMAANSLSYKASVLSDLITSKGLEVEMREVEVEGEKKPVAHVRAKGDEKAKWEPLGEHAERNWEDYLPALKQGKSDKAGVLYPDQNGEGKAPSSQDVVGKVTGRFVRPSKLNNN